jgi:hypothetical protein
MFRRCPLQWVRLSLIVAVSLGTVPPVWPAPQSERLVDRAEHLIAQADRLIAQADRLLAQAEPSPAPPPASGEAPSQSVPDSEAPPAEKTEAPPPSDAGEKPQPAATPQPEQPAAGAGQTEQPAAGAGQKEQPAAGATQKDQPAPGAAQAQAGAAQAQKDQPAEEEREVARVPLAAVQAGGLLLARDQMIIEPTIFYTYSQNTRLIVTGFSVLPLIILGGLESEKVTTNLVSPALQVRYGLYRGLQLDFRIPVTYADSTRLRVSTDRAGQVEESQNDFGISDINFGLTYQFLYERGWLPDLMLRVGANAPTGKSQFDIFRDIANKGALTSAEQFLNALNTSGVALGAGRWTITTSVNAVKAMDPAILFATVGWNYTPASTEDLIQINAQPVSGGVLLQPQLVSARLGAVNGLLTSLGLAISLNNQLSVNFSFSDLYNASSTANGVKIPGSQVNIGQFNFGMNLAISPQTTLNFVGQIGITDDAPSMTFLTSVPIFYNNAVETAYSFLKSSFTDLFRGKPAPVEKPAGKPAEKPKEPGN